MKKIVIIILVAFAFVSSGALLSQDVEAGELSAKKLIIKAKKGIKDRQFELAQRYTSGYKEIKKDVKQAFHWYLQAGSQGHAKAQTMLGIFYKNGIGTDKNVVEAKEWYKKGASNGDILADLNHGLLLLQEKDYTGSDVLLQNVVHSDSSDSLDYKGSASYGRSKISLAAGDKQEAYSWYVLAMLSNAVRYKNLDDEPYLKEFINLRKSLSPDQYKKALNKAREYHFLYFVKHMYYIKKHKKELTTHNNALFFKKPKHRVGYMAYHSYRYKKIHGAVNYFKNEMDKKSRVNYGYWLAEQANAYFAHGSLDLNYSLGLSSLEKADKVFDKYFYENSLKYLDKIVKEKVVIVKDLVAIQNANWEEFRDLKKRNN